jgi:hypothetical protein
MKADGTSAAIVSGVLALPFAIIFALLVLHIEPPFGPLGSMLKVEVDRPNVVGSAIVFGAWLLSVVALVFAVAPIVRGMRAGVGIAASPLNLLVAGVILVLVVSFVAGVVIDQYPCWIGVPNCD